MIGLYFKRSQDFENLPELLSFLLHVWENRWTLHLGSSGRAHGFLDLQLYEAHWGSAADFQAVWSVLKTRIQFCQ